MVCGCALGRVRLCALYRGVLRVFWRQYVAAAVEDMPALGVLDRVGLAATIRVVIVAVLVSRLWWLNCPSRLLTA